MNIEMQTTQSMWNCGCYLTRIPSQNQIRLNNTRMINEAEMLANLSPYCNFFFPVHNIHLRSSSKLLETIMFTQQLQNMTQLSDG